MSQRELLLQGDLEAYFEDVLEDTLKLRGNRPDELVQQYLLGLLGNSARMDQWLYKTLAQPLPFLLRDALQAEAAVRFDELRKLGDGVLMVSGLYRQHLERMGLDDKYVSAFGSRAYEAASAVLCDSSRLVGAERSAPDILRQLADGFRDIVQVLRDLSHTLVVRSAQSTADLVKLFEQWLDSRSEHLGRLLEAHGFVLQPAPRALLH